jgi:hypothetical protein
MNDLFYLASTLDQSMSSLAIFHYVNKTRCCKVMGRTYSIFETVPALIAATLPNKSTCVVLI